MASGRTAWHVLFGALLRERKPEGFDVLCEVPLADEPQRADYLLLRRLGPSADDRARVLRSLWPRIKRDALVELKSVSRPVGRGDLVRLLGYGAQYAAKERERFGSSDDLLLVLVTPSVTPTLEAEVEFLRGVSLSSTDGGYAELTGLVFPAVVVVLDEVSEQERDEVLALFGHGRPTSQEAYWWFDAHVWGAKGDSEMADIEALEGFDEVVQRFMKAWIQGRGPDGVAKDIEGEMSEEQLEQFLSNLPPELLAKAAKKRRD